MGETVRQPNFPPGINKAFLILIPSSEGTHVYLASLFTLISQLVTIKATCLNSTRACVCACLCVSVCMVSQSLFLSLSLSLPIRIQILTPSIGI